MVSSDKKAYQGPIGIVSEPVLPKPKEQLPKPEDRLPLPEKDLPQPLKNLPLPEKELPLPEKQFPLSNNLQNTPAQSIPDQNMKSAITKILSYKVNPVYFFLILILVIVYTAFITSFFDK